MAIWTAKNPRNYVKDVLDKSIGYTADLLKTNSRLIRGIMCPTNVEAAVRSMWVTKRVFHKTDKRQIYHNIISFAPDEYVTPREALDITEEIMKTLYHKHQVFIAAHTDKAHLHTHSIINSVSVDGSKLHFSRKDFLAGRELVNRILQQHGKRPLVGCEELIFEESMYTDDDQANKDWFELYTDDTLISVTDEEDIQMNNNYDRELYYNAANGFCCDNFDDDDNDMGLIDYCRRECYPPLELPSRHFYPEQLPAIRIIGNPNIVSNNSPEFNIADDYKAFSQILDHIPSRVLAGRNVEIVGSANLCGVSQEVVDSIAAAATGQELVRIEANAKAAGDDNRPRIEDKRT